MEIQSFKVFGLHGKSDYDIHLKDNSLILVAENGSGKTTIVNMFYYFLSRQWRKLNEYKFSKIIIQINSKEYSFEKKNFDETILRESRMSKKFFPRYNKIVQFIVENYNIFDLRKNPDLIEILSNQYDIPVSIIHEIFMMYKDEEHRIEKDNKVQKLEEILNEIFEGTQIVYLPTYRRIEKDLKNIFPH